MKPIMYDLMEKAFSFFMPTRVEFGAGAFQRLPGYLCHMGMRRVLIVTGKSSMRRMGYAQQLEQSLCEKGMEVRLFEGMSPDPRTEEVNACVAEQEGWRPDVLVALGGGSAIDGAKAVALGFTTSEPIEEYLHGRRNIERVDYPIIAVPTTPGTGAEVNKAAILTDAAAGVKTSFRHEGFFPKLAVVDPVLTVSLSQKITRDTGFDILAHSMETAISRSAQSPMVLSFSLESLGIVGRMLPRALADGTDMQARIWLMYAGMLMGMNLAHSSTCLPHRLQYPLSVMTGASHGAGLMALFPSWLESTYDYSSEQFDMLGTALTGEKIVGWDEFVKGYQGYIEKIGGPITLSDLGLGIDDIDKLVQSVQGDLRNDPAGGQDGIVRKIYLDGINKKSRGRWDGKAELYL